MVPKMHSAIYLAIEISSIIVLAHGIVLRDKPLPKHHTKQNSFHYRQSPQKCDLICPGVPPLTLPPNFIRNCSSVVNTSTKGPQNIGNSTSTTSIKPSTTTESGEASEETDESTEETVDTSSKASGKITKNRNIRHQIAKNINHLSQSKKKLISKQLQQHHNKGQIRKEKVLLKRAIKKQIFTHNKHFQGRSTLDGCYVTCFDGTSGPGSQGSIPGGINTDESGSDDYEFEPYVPGEETAIEILYLPDPTTGNQRAGDLYQTNYAFLEPQPAIGYGYEPFFMEGKQNRNKKQPNSKKKEKILRNMVKVTT